MPEKVESIGENAFQGCTNLNLFFLDKTKSEIESMQYYPWGLDTSKIFSKKTVMMDDLTSGLACNSIEAKSILVDGVPPSLEGHTHDDEYKPLQEAKSSPVADGRATQFIDTISQDANGEITATKKNIASASTSQAGIV